MTNKFDALFEERNKFDDLMGPAPVLAATPKPGTVAALIERYIAEMDGGVRPSESPIASRSAECKRLL
jgi:hypothetical protein